MRPAIILRDDKCVVFYVMLRSAICFENVWMGMFGVILLYQLECADVMNAREIGDHN